MNKHNQPSNENNLHNPRDGINLKKYRNQIAWRRNKVKELLARGYAQYEISNILHISQPTVSRDIHYIQKELRKSTDNYGHHLFEIYRNTQLGLDEAIKKLWETIDSPKTEGKERIKAIILLKACYKERLDLIKSEPGLIQQKKLMDEVKLFSDIGEQIPYIKNPIFILQQFIDCIHSHIYGTDIHRKIPCIIDFLAVAILLCLFSVFDLLTLCQAKVFRF